MQEQRPTGHILSVLPVDHFDQVQLSRHCPTRICLTTDKLAAFSKPQRLNLKELEAMDADLTLD
jgi:hypothetical protein